MLLGLHVLSWLKAGSCRKTQVVEEAQMSLVVPEYIWMCLSDKFIISSAARQLLDKSVAYYAYYCCIYQTAATSDSVFCALFTNSITYLFTLDLFAAPLSSISTSLGGG